MNHVSQNIKLLRHRAHLTQEAAAKRVNVKQRTWAAWENRRGTPNLAKLHDLSIMFRISMHALVFSEVIPCENIKYLAGKKRGKYKKYTPPEIGCKCKFSSCWLKIEPRCKTRNRIGVIAFETKDKICWRVIWEGTHTAQAYHKDFIEILS